MSLRKPRKMFVQPNLFFDQKQVLHFQRPRSRLPYVNAKIHYVLLVVYLVLSLSLTLPPPLPFLERRRHRQNLSKWFLAHVNFVKRSFLCVEGWGISPRIREHMRRRPLELLRSFFKIWGMYFMHISYYIGWFQTRKRTLTQVQESKRYHVPGSAAQVPVGKRRKAPHLHVLNVTERWLILAEGYMCAGKLSYGTIWTLKMLHAYHLQWWFDLSLTAVEPIQ